MSDSANQQPGWADRDIRHACWIGVALHLVGNWHDNGVAFVSNHQLTPTKCTTRDKRCYRV